ncbi:MAG TPA: RHS repeat protein [Candidatus Wallbacteria bacterium]|nr:RHS repeat protein [Candidatus Wallbacteria bacterium]
MNKYKSTLLLSAAIFFILLVPKPAAAEQDLEKEMNNILMAKKNKLEYLVRAQNIKSISQAFYDYNEKLKAYDPNPTRRLTIFNENGDKTEERRISYDSKAKAEVITDIYNYSYNEIRNVTGENHSQLNAATNSYEIVSKQIYKYNEKNKLIETLNYDSEGFIGSITRSYDKNQFEIEKNEFNKEKQMILKTLFKYDENGNKTDMDEYNVTNGKVCLKTNTKYDKLGNETTVTACCGETIDTVTTYSYDIAGNITESVKTDSKGKIIEKKSFEYDDVKNLTGETQTDSNNQTVYKANYKYNEKNKLTEEQCYRLKSDPKTGKSSLALTDKYSHVYNEQDNPSLSTRYDEKDTPVSKATANYDFYAK